MSAYTSSSCANTSRTRTKSRGWAAFDLSEKQKHVVQDAINEDPFPPISSNVTASHSFEYVPRKSDFPKRSFSSVTKHAASIPSLAESVDQTESTNFGILPKIKHVEKDSTLACEKLKELHGWADDNLIEDVITAVEGDIIKASSLLKEMEPTSLEEMKKMQMEKNNEDKTISSGASTDFAENIADLSSAIEDVLKFGQQESRDLGAFSSPLSDDAAANMKLILGHVKSILVEPEWEEDDIYLSYRKTALRVMRTASQHSRAATNAFLRGDHSSAQQHSLKAREEWLAAERLNACAAREILRARNSSNDPWKLDLHGLHKLEATQALQEHLQKIETQVSTGGPIHPNDVNGKRYSSSATTKFSQSMEADVRDKRNRICRGRPRQLQVITGIGNHSRGEAALPAAVRSFLDNNGYHYDEMRPGVITVWPKFRHK